MNKGLLSYSLAFILLFLSNTGIAQSASYGVVYPDLREPYRSIFINIIEGIKDSLGEETQALALKKTDGLEEVENWVEKYGINSLISLGTRPYKYVSVIDLEHVIAGAIIKPPSPNGLNSGILLTPDPHEVFAQMHELLPQVETIYAVYSDEISRWYVDLAKQAAEEVGIDLQAMPARSKKEAVMMYREVLEKASSKRNAIWLLQDPISSDNRVILPLILEKAWDKYVPVISNTAGHVERGVLLAIYPDHFELGIALAEMLKEKGDSFRPFPNGLRAANTRTAEHLELNWKRKTKREFDLVFPR